MLCVHPDVIARDKTIGIAFLMHWQIFAGMEVLRGFSQVWGHELHERVLQLELLFPSMKSSSTCFIEQGSRTAENVQGSFPAVEQN